MIATMTLGLIWIRRTASVGALTLVGACGGSDSAPGASGQSSATDTDAGTGTDGPSSGGAATSFGSSGEFESSSTGFGSEGSVGVVTGDITSASGSTSTGEELGPGVYVHVADGADSNDGTAVEPVRTIARGIELAVELGFGAVYVAEGSYPQNSNDNQVVEVVDGVSLYGGFSAADWDDRDPASFPSVLVDGADAPGGATPQAPHHALRIPVGVPTSTEVDGFVIEASGQAFSAAVLVQGEGTVSHSRLVGGPSMLSPAVAVAEAAAASLLFNDIDGLIADPGLPSFAIRGSDCEVTAVGNTIRSGEGATNRAVALTNATGTFMSNVVIGELGEGGDTRAFELTDSAVAIIGNTLLVEASGLGYFILLGGTSVLPALENNNFIPRSDSTWCFLGGGSDPLSVRGNNFNCSMLYSGSTAYTTIGALEAGVRVASDNVSAEAGVVDADADWHLLDDGSVLCAVARGGVEPTSSVADIDFDEEPRTDPRSIGADEYDGQCL